ncbi:MAG: hypothetical protein FRX48_08186 [Lasallia pustulata]|uniref:Uncharacterized protein n=1 Tax=Lasallia pustulata TaxID=136370 RepID=A0A5M8PF30_9LECA|nr:MAG: hypothetical protein FRX48_08186 [Lasallia pustulata]
MSSDLWKEFGGASQDPSENPWAQSVSRDGGSSAQDDISYAFPTSTGTEKSVVRVGGVGLRPDSSLEENVPSGTASPFDAGEDVWGDLRSLGLPKTSLPYRQGGLPDGKNSVEVLFDAADELSIQDDDEFGDFESPNSQPSEEAVGLPLSAPIPSRSSRHLLSDLEHLSLEASPYPQAPKSPSFQERNPFSDLAVSTKPATEPGEKDASPITAWPSYVQQKPAPYMDSPMDFLAEESDWGEFIDGSASGSASADKARNYTTLEPLGKNGQFHNMTVPSISTSQTRGLDVSTVAHASLNMPDDIMPNPPNGNFQEATKSVLHPARNMQPTLLAAMQTPMQSGTVPPSNIPPPSVILTLFPSLFLSLPSEIKALFRAPKDLSESRNYIEHARMSGMKVCLLVATVAARIIGGRALRWKRDTHLSQSMRVGPAHAGKVGGMKLTGLDKTEMLRQNREVLEVVRVWKQQVGKVRSAVSSANSQLEGSTFKVPAVSENAPVRTAKAADGAISAPNSCVLCGLKREERLDKADFDVEDSFDEWWTEHWGHTECRIFWEEHKGTLAKH